MHFEKFSAKMFLSPSASTQLEEKEVAPEARNEECTVKEIYKSGKATCGEGEKSGSDAGVSRRSPRDAEVAG